MLKLQNKFNPKKILIPIIGCLLSSALFAQPYEGDLEIYTGSVATGSGNTSPNILFVADTSGSMDEYVAVEYQSTKDSYDPSFDYGGDGAHADDDLIYVYDDIETFSGVTITQAQNKCQAMTNTFTNSPNYPVYTDKVLQWKPITSEVEITPAVVCETTSPSSTTIDLVSEGIANSWDEMFFNGGTKLYEDSFISGSEMTLTVSNTGSRDMKGGIWVARTNSSGTQTGAGYWLCYKSYWDSGQTESCTASVNSISYTYYEIEVWFDGRYGSTSASGSLEYNKNAPGVQVDPTCSPADAVTAEVVTDGEWSGSLETNSDSGYILECADDAGNHGIDSVSTDVEAAFCGTADCTSPRYVASSGVDWTSEGLDDKFFYTGNYHDYLNYVPPFPTDLGIPIFDSRERHYVRYRNGTTWYQLSNGNRSPESFCDLIDTFWNFAVDFTDSSTWSGQINDPPTTNQLYVYDSDDPSGFVYICRHKQTTMINALNDMVSSLSGVNVGLMRFNSNSQGGSVIFHTRDIDDYMTPGDTSSTSVRSALTTAINGLPASGGTPLLETLYESYLYFKQEDADQAGSNTDSSAYSASPKYDSPIENSCQSNNIIYISDGDPSSDTGRMNTIEGITGTNCYQSSSGASQSGGYTQANSCLDDLAHVMKTENMRPDLDGNSHVTTYGIGFNLDIPVLEDMAESGGGQYFTADSYDDLITAFQEILLEISVSEPSTLVAPAVSVNAFNELRHRNQIYYATFTPSYNPAWEGNVKRYGLAGDGVIYGQAGESTPVISDDGFFKSSAQSFWSDNPDGSIVEEGGFREQLTNLRNVYVDASTVVGGGSGIIKLTPTSNLDDASLGIPSGTSEDDELRDWLLGIDVDDYNGNSSILDAHQYAADSLHSRPFVITYSGTNVDNARDILFLTTNMGEIRAIDARLNQGTELWSYMLPEFMENIKMYRDNSSAFRHWNAYGLDGEATVYTEEAEGSSSTNFNIGTAYMFQGMRRGGKDYFAWDISNADLEDSSSAPISQKWKIAGGTGNFADMGYSWSRMVQSTIRWGCTDASKNTGCTTKDVLIFGGGYDGHYDTESSTFNNSDSVDGDAVYIVDMETGNLLWSAGNHSGHSIHQDPDNNTLPMYDSIPSDPSPIDIDRDGDMDMLFVVDISGKIFRFDFDQTTANASGVPASGYASGGMIANLRDGTNKRRFYNGLDVSFLAPPGETPFFTLSVGSGYRANPKDEETWNNRLYVVVDENLTGPLLDDNGTPDDLTDDKAIYKYRTTVDNEGVVTARAVITQSDLHNATSVGYIKGDNGKDYGFYRNFSSTIYEKVLQETATFGGEIFVSTYSPVSATTAAGTCGAAEIGSGRVYRFSLETGLSTLNDNGDGIEIEVPGIPTEFTWLILDEGLTLCTGTICTSTAKTDPDDTPEDDDDILDWNSLDEAGLAPNGQIGSAIRTYWFEQ